MLDRGQTGERTRGDGVDSFDRVTVPEAAARLGLSESAIYKRIQRGRFKYETERDDDGRLWIYLPAVDTGETVETVQDTPQSTETVDELRARIASLEAELARLWEAYETLQDDYRDEKQRADMILLEAIRRTPALESGHVQDVEPRQDIEDTGETRLPWWRRIWQ